MRKLWHDIQGLEVINTRNEEPFKIRVYECPAQRQWTIKVGLIFDDSVIKNVLYSEWYDICKQYNINPETDEGFTFHDFIRDRVEDVWRILYEYCLMKNV